MNKGCKDTRGMNLSPQPCVICFTMFQPRTSIQETCGAYRCVEENKKRKNVYKNRRVVPDNKKRFSTNGGAVVVAAPDEYLDYIGLEYSALEWSISLEEGLLPPGVTVRNNGKKFKVCGQPTPIDRALSGGRKYCTQWLEAV